MWVLGNHDMTLDAPFFEANRGGIFGHPRWPDTRSSEENKKLFTESNSITYLENEAATIYLNAKNGPHTCFKVFSLAPSDPLNISNSNRRYLAAQTSPTIAIGGSRTSLEQAESFGMPFPQTPT